MGSKAYREWEEGAAPLPRYRARAGRAEVEAPEGAAELPEPEERSPKRATRRQAVGRGLRHAVAAIVFILIGFGIFTIVDGVLSPYQLTGIMTDKARAFYEEPNDTLEVLFLGPSHAGEGFIPTQLWEDEGICSYNLGTCMQPIFTSYTLAKEAYARHSRTLRTIVADISTLLYDPGDAFYRLPLDELPLPTKLEPVLEWQGTREGDPLVYLSSLYAYHSRWSELTAEDWQENLWEPHAYLRGYEPGWKTFLLDSWPADEHVLATTPDLSAEPAELDPTAVRYLRELADFCESHGITLVLLKTPVFSRWSDGDHVAVQQLASELGVDFLDLNYEPFFTATGYNQLADTRDSVHPNNRGAAKITGYVGAYLKERGLAGDLRGNPAYAFMDEQLPQARAAIEGPEALRSIVDLPDYLEYAMGVPEYTVYVAVDGEGAAALTDDQRSRLAELGLSRMAALKEGDNYHCVIENGEVASEEYSESAARRVYGRYADDEYVLPEHGYFKMFESGEAEAIQALAYQTDPESVESRPEWRIEQPGASVVVWDGTAGAVVDSGPFLASFGLKRYANPEQTLQERLDAGAGDADLPWSLRIQKHYDDWYRETLAAQTPSGAS